MTFGGTIFEAIWGALAEFLLWGGQDFQPHPQSQMKHYYKHSVGERGRR
jgi:hypothetical protein